MDLIDRKLAIEKVKATADAWLPDLPYGPYKQGFILGTEVAIDTISSFVPSAEKTGKWDIDCIWKYELSDGTFAYEPVYRCSVCGGIMESYLRLDKPIMPDDADFPKYCPNCGARMEVEHETN